MWIEYLFSQKSKHKASRFLWNTISIDADSHIFEKLTFAFSFSSHLIFLFFKSEQNIWHCLKQDKFDSDFFKKNILQKHILVHFLYSLATHKFNRRKQSAQAGQLDIFFEKGQFWLIGLKPITGQKEMSSFLLTHSWIIWTPVGWKPTVILVDTPSLFLSLHLVDLYLFYCLVSLVKIFLSFSARWYDNDIATTRLFLSEVSMILWKRLAVYSFKALSIKNNFLWWRYETEKDKRHKVPLTYLRVPSLPVANASLCVCYLSSFILKLGDRNTRLFLSGLSNCLDLNKIR